MKKSADPQVELLSFIERYAEFATSIKPFSSPSDTAQYMLMSRSCNAFSAAVSLCLSGFFVESYNSVRVGLETGWLSLILRGNAEQAFEWLTMIPSDTSMKKAERRYRNSFGSPVWIRQNVSPEGKGQRDNLYKILSTKSHANVAASFFISPSASDSNDLCLYGPSPFNCEVHRSKHLQGILYCLECLLHEVQLQCSVDLGVAWKHDEVSLFNIAGVGFPDAETGVKVVPENVNAAYQAMFLLRLFMQQQS